MNTSATDQTNSLSGRDNLSEKRSSAVTFQNRFDSISYSLFGNIYEEKIQTGTLENRMRESGYGISPELYASRLTLYSLITAACSTLLLLSLGAVAQILLFDSLNFLPYLPSNIAVTLSNVPGIQTLGVAFIVYTISLLASAFVFRYWPRYLSNQRERNINETLPYAVSYMFALSRGGMTTVEILKSIANSRNTYGAISEEIETIVKDIVVFNMDTPEAMRRASERTASDEFATFADDYVNMQTTGADMTNFFENKMDQYLEKAETKQERFISFLEFIGEVYVTVFVAGPLFALIIIMVLAMVGGGSGVQISGVVYAILPIVNLLFYFFISTITPDDGVLSRTLDASDDVVDLEEAKRLNETVDDERLEKIIEKKKKRERTRILTDPVGYFSENPLVTAVVTVPIAAIVFVLGYQSGLVTFSTEAILSNPETPTLYGFLIPFWIVSVPIAVLELIKTRKDSKTLSRFPDALDQLASTNSVGLTLAEALGQVAESTSGRLGKELKKTSREIQWRNDINAALKSFANRIRNPTVARTVKLITDANKSTGDIAKVLRVAARDVGTRQRLRSERNSAMWAYVGVITISYLVYLGVIFQIDSAFLTTIAEVSQQQSQQAAQQAAPQSSGSSGFDLASIPIKLFRTAFYHSVIIQGVGSGILAGTLKNNSPVSGLKYSIIFTIFAAIVLLL